MSSRRVDSLHGSFARLPASMITQTAQCNFTLRGLPMPTGLTPSPQHPTSATSTPPSAYVPPKRPGEHCLLEKHAIASYSSQPTQRATSLSVYERPTATFMWPNFRAKAAESRAVDPIIYVKYRPGQDKSTQDDSDLPNSSPSLSARSSLSSEPSNLTARSTPASTPPREMSRKRSSSPETDDNPASPSDRFLKRPRLFERRVASERIITAPAPSVDHPPAHLAERELRRSFQTLGIASDGSDVDMQHEPVAHAVHQSKSDHVACPPQSAAPPAVNVAPKGKAPMPLKNDAMKNEWLKYVEKRPQEEIQDGREWMCTWYGEKEDGTVGPCEYKAKKHLIKRHIESKHLQLRPWPCSYCNKRFSQKSNLDTHLNTHTGLMPHKCLYCDIMFKDPARRQRHMGKDHGHETIPQKKKRLAAERKAAQKAANDASSPKADEGVVLDAEGEAPEARPDPSM